MPFSESVLNICAATPAWLRMPTPITEIFTTSAELLMSKWPMSAFAFFSTSSARAQLGRLNGEGHVRMLAVRRDVLDDHVDVDAGVRQRPEDARRDARLVVDLEKRHLGLVLGVGDAANDLLFHDLILVANDGSDIFDIVRPEGLHGVGRNEAREHARLDLVDHRQLDRARLQNLGPERRHFQHFFIRNLGEPPRLRNDARVGRIDAVDVGIDVADVGFERDRNRDGAGIRAAAAERRDAVVLRLDALKAGDDGDLAAVDALLEIAARNIRRCAPRRARRSVLIGTCQPCQERALRPIACSDDRQQPGGHLLAGRDDGIIFARVVERRRLLHPGDELVGRCPPSPRRRRRPCCRHRPRA